MKNCKKIIVSAGHGYSDSAIYKILPMTWRPKDNGAVAWNGTRERDVVEDIAVEIEGYLVQKIGVQNRYSLSNKIHAINAICKKEGLDSSNSILIEIHANSGGYTTATGCECWYYTGSSEGKKLADCITKEISSKTGIRARSSKGDQSGRFGTAGFGIIRRTAPLAIIVECGYMGNPTDLSKMINEPETFAKAIMQGVNNYLS